MCTYPSQPIHLWQFLRELLLKPHNYSRCIRWLNKEKGEAAAATSTFFTSYVVLTRTSGLVARRRSALPPRCPRCEIQGAAVDVTAALTDFFQT